MVGTLVDANILLDIATDDSRWSRRSATALEHAADAGPLIVNQIVYAEVSIGYTRIEDVDAAMAADVFVREDLPWAAAFLAGKAFLAYRRRGGVRRSPLPDFYIGAHAAVAGHRLLTRDARRYRTSFPTVEIALP